ncbi:ParB N-terminal domain-containing protein [Vibrio sp. Makdt]|uniref:ParB N-terminal domain-containing protein n=1 Tax=Vibrio sp. Makdt TaxID=2998828 RepID=UPI0022CD77CB|nr:ParB N-terminal domain-containing protein [Vibrio sp. Makdt]MDA0152437.1 ParB N-terminal domain-containing protein [Vibrio sp. Makdt]
MNTSTDTTATKSKTVDAASLSSFNEETMQLPSVEAGTLNQIDTGNKSGSAIIYRKHGELRATPMGNYRKRRDPAKYAETKASVLIHGFLQNIVVREATIDGADVLEVVAGYGRWQIASELYSEHGIDIDLPCLNKGRISDSEALSIALDENNKRSDDSISERAELAKEYIGLEGGDIGTAAIKLNVSENVFRDLLQLTNCCEPLLDALDDSQSPVKKGHCLALSQFDETIQKQTLESIIANPSEYTVSYVKKRLSNFELNLSLAKFDTTDCSSCQHNSGGAYCFMFKGDESDKCNNPSCFQEKSKLWLEEVRKPDLEERFGKVITSTIKPKSQVRMATPDTVGKTQFKDCQNCTNCVAYVHDSGAEFGEAFSNVCIDLDCHSKQVKKHQEFLNPKAKKANAQTESAEDTAAILARAAAKNGTSTSEPDTDKKDVVAPKAKANKKEAQTPSDKSPVETEQQTQAKLSKKIQRTYANMLQDAVAETIHTNPSFALAVIAMSVDSSLRSPKFGKETITTLCNKTPQELQVMVQNSIAAFTKQMVLMDSDASDKTKFNANEVMRNTFSLTIENNADDPRNIAEIEKQKKAVIIESWKPTKDLLSIFTIQQLAIIANESGFEQAYCAAKGKENAWAQITNSSKDKVLSALLDFEFDWASYAPKSYIEMGLTYTPHA